jgi:hypothetical protein
MTDPEAGLIEETYGAPIYSVPAMVDEPAPDPDAESPEEEGGSDDRDLERPHRVAAWVAIVGGLALAAFFVAVPAHTYDLRVRLHTQRIDLIELWRVQTRNLPDVRYQALFQFVFVACAIAFLIGSAVLIWLAMVEIGPAATPASSRDRAANATAEPAPES